ncbi:MAG: V-type ATP synthase subunit E family protein, partial [Sedimenticolaceae bacterium]
MSQSGQNQLEALERAIMARAEELAQGFHDKASRQHDTILRDTAERLKLAEEREVLVAKAEAERHFRRVTQASELKMQARLDQLRWELVQTVEARLAQRMQALRADRPAYRAWLVEMIRDAASVLPAGELTAEVNAEDLYWL